MGGINFTSASYWLRFVFLILMAVGRLVKDKVEFTRSKNVPNILIKNIL
jgi:hypothetical protein